MLDANDKEEIKRLIATEIAKALAASKIKNKPTEQIAKPRVRKGRVYGGGGCEGGRGYGSGRTC